MVTQFKGWKAEDGTVFETRDEAVRHEARKQFMTLLRSDGCNEGQVAKMGANFEAYAELFGSREKNKAVASK